MLLIDPLLATGVAAAVACCKLLSLAAAEEPRAVWGVTSPAATAAGVLKIPSLAAAAADALAVLGVPIRPSSAATDLATSETAPFAAVLLPAVLGVLLPPTLAAAVAAAMAAAALGVPGPPTLPGATAVPLVAASAATFLDPPAHFSLVPAFTIFLPLAALASPAAVVAACGDVPVLFAAGWLAELVIMGDLVGVLLGTGGGYPMDGRAVCEPEGDTFGEPRLLLDEENVGERAEGEEAGLARCRAGTPPFGISGVTGDEGLHERAAGAAGEIRER